MSSPANSSPIRNHIRRPDLPWRQSRLTECGRQTNDVTGLLDRAEALAMIKRDGIQRAAYSLCMTCINTARNHPEWDTDPYKALAREFFGAPDPQLPDELRALGALVTAHRDEFEGFITGLQETASLADARRRRARTGR